MSEAADGTAGGSRPGRSLSTVEYSVTDGLGVLRLNRA
jgi:hypothetical protein